MSAADASHRQMKAIMFSDIKGFSAMMGKDEQGTVKALLEHREIVRACLAAHDGTEHETIGDAFVVLFDSVVNAVRCAVDIQAKLKARNEALPANEQVVLRIGIHLGDIIMQGDGIYGDGVNVAARVQDKADPGGISITEQVFLQLDGKVDLPMQSLGKIDLKNIKNPPSLYRIQLDGLVPPKPHRAWVPVVAVIALLVGAIGVALAVKNGEPPPLASPLPPPPPIAAAPAVAPVDVAKSAAGRKMAEALAKGGQERVDLLRQALQLDPDNAAVQNLLVVALQAVAIPVAVTPTAAPAVAVPALPAPPAAAPKGPSHAKPKADAETKIKRSVIE